MKQHESAVRILDLMKQNPSHVWTYAEAGREIGMRGDCGRPAGQAVSRLCLAFLYAGRPLLTMTQIQSVNYGVREIVFGELFIPHREEIIAAIDSHQWSTGDWQSAAYQLHTLPRTCAVELWQRAASRQRANPEFVRHHLHRHVTPPATAPIAV